MVPAKKKGAAWARCGALRGRRIAVRRGREAREDDGAGGDRRERAVATEGYAGGSEMSWMSRMIGSEEGWEMQANIRKKESTWDGQRTDNYTHREVISRWIGR